ncbi:MAG: transglutaminase family protein [Deltaproteobacteria bacterium]|nr:transglutaminase family protein [Deltaproteobacteria bacterium]
MARLTVRHRTRYAYSTPARYSVQSLRLTPPRFDGQRVISWTVSAPGIQRALIFTDAFDNQVHQLTVTGAHDEIEVEAAGTVETEDRNGVVSGLPESVPLRVYLRQTPRTEPDAAMRALAGAVRGDGIIAQLHDLMARVRDAVDYEIGATHARTGAAQALADGRGVCQDHAHIFISAARIRGIPARYVTGYLLVEHEVRSSAQHAWAEARVDGLGWLGFDVANRICPTQQYVRLACGLDSCYAAPVRGFTRGGDGESLDVQVEVQQQSAQQ